MLLCRPDIHRGGTQGEYKQCLSASEKQASLIRKMMNEKYNKHLQRSMELAKELIILADEGESDSVDNGCRILYGIVRDCAYKIKAQAQSETKKHLFKTIEDKFAHPNAQP